MKYLKWIFKDNIGEKDNKKFEVGKVIICDTWDPNNSDWDKRGGFNFTNEECALRWMFAGKCFHARKRVNSAGRHRMIRTRYHR